MICHFEVGRVRRSPSDTCVPVTDGPPQVFKPAMWHEQVHIGNSSPRKGPYSNLETVRRAGREQIQLLILAIYGISYPKLCRNRVL